MGMTSKEWTSGPFSKLSPPPNKEPFAPTLETFSLSSSTPSTIVSTSARRWLPTHEETVQALTLLANIEYASSNHDWGREFGPVLHDATLLAYLLNKLAAADTIRTPEPTPESANTVADALHLASHADDAGQPRLQKIRLCHPV